MKSDKKKKKKMKEQEESSTQGSTKKENIKKASKKDEGKKAKVVWLEQVGKGDKKESGNINPKTTQIVINLNKNQVEASQEESNSK